MAVAATAYRAVGKALLADFEEMEAVGKKRVPLAERAVADLDAIGKSGEKATEELSAAALSTLSASTWLLRCGLFVAVLLGLGLATAAAGYRANRERITRDRRGFE